VLDLSQYRVLELGTGISIPLCGTVLRNLGADVIKIESRRKLDVNRTRSRPRGWRYGDSVECFWQFHEVNAGKRSITLNLKHPKGRDLLMRLVAQADVLIQNFAPGWLDRLGIAVDDFWTANPRLVMVFASAYGQEGPLRAQRAWAPIMSALAGLEGLVGYDTEPTEVMGALATALGDPNGSYFAVFYVLAGLYHREQTGQGILFDLSFTEAVTSLLGEPLWNVQEPASGEKGRLLGNHAPNRAPHGIYPCLGDDQWVAISVPHDDAWEALADVITQDLNDAAWRKADWKRFGGRKQDEPAIDAIISQWTRNRIASEIVTVLQSRGIPSAPVVEVMEIEAEEVFRTRDLWHEVYHDELGHLLLTGTPWRVDGASPPVRGPGPHLGQDNEDVYVGLCGLDADQYAALQGEGAFD